MLGPMSELTDYKGSCHCGKVRFEVQADLTGTLATCNCSICSRTGALMAFVPETHFKVLEGADALSDYQFGKKHIHHLFCSHCGVRPYGRGASPGGGEMYMINVRCLEGVDLGALKSKEYDGRSL